MSLALVHLVRKENGIAALRAFAESYRAVPAGADHDLVLVLKGFDSTRDAREHAARAGAVADAELLVADEGFDLGAYFAAADRLDHDRLCFVNSFTTARATGWLGLLDAAASAPGAGLVGATGSWASHWSWARYELFLPSTYTRIFESRTVAAEQMLRAARAQGAALARRTSWPPWRLLGALRRSPFFARGFDQFPAYHLRTNGFLIASELMRSLDRERIETKFDAYRLESGVSSIMRQVEALGLAALVAGADRRVYNRDEWAASRTFWQGNQENRLLDDNQTRVYDRGDLPLRDFLARFAWGGAAAPEAPP
ncbi:MAG: hypothetical protein ABR569_05850 [Gaiellaceae bacterium]